jgi:hypothetical protein
MAAAKGDPLRAALQALWVAATAHGRHGHTFLAESGA